MKYLIYFLMLLPTQAHAARAIMEGIAATNSTVFVDTKNVRVGINNVGPSYTVDVGGDLNIGNSNAIRIGGTSICTSAGCTSSGGGGGGSSSLAVTTGNPQGNWTGTVASSPTAVIVFDSMTVIAGAMSSTFTFKLNPSSVTLLGQLIAGSNITLTPGTNNLTIAATGGGGGGATPVAFGTGTTSGFIGNITSTPTAIFLGNSSQFSGTLQGNSTFFFSALPSTFTMVGQILAGSNISLTNGTNNLTIAASTSGVIQTIGFSTGNPSGWSGSTFTATNLNFSSTTFAMQLGGGATTFLTVNTTSITAVGQLIAGSNITLTPGTNNLTIAATSSGGGGSSLAVTTGNPQGNWTGTVASSPTAVIVFDSMTVIAGAMSSTFTFKLNPASATLVGQLIAGSNITLTPGTNNLTIAATSGGGGSSTLAITTGTVNYSAQVTSPTIAVQFDSRTFVGSVTQTSTAAIQLNSSSVTLVGQIVAGTNVTLTPGTNNLTIAVSSATLSIGTGSSSGWTGSLINFAVGVGGGSGGSGSSNAVSTFVYVFNGEQALASSGTYIARSTNSLTGGVYFPNLATSTASWTTVLQRYQGGQLNLSFIYTSTATSGTVGWNAAFACVESTSASNPDTVSYNVSASSTVTENSGASAPTKVTMLGLPANHCAPNGIIAIDVWRQSGDSSVGYAYLRKLVVYEQ